MSDDDPYAGDKLDCDIVMKGGITSGVVYPGAISKLAAHYRFRAIGGTSAGAIAAAILAAAEHRRQSAPKDAAPTAGFSLVEQLPTTLGKAKHGELKLMRLFQPDKATKGLFAVMKGFMKHGKLLGIPLIWLALPLFPVIGAALIALCVLLQRGGDVGSTVAWIGFVAGGLLVLIGPFVQIGRTVVRLPANFYGLCTLGPGSVGKGAALTEWLHEQIQAAAGRTADGPVLTFADLWGIDPALVGAQRTQALLDRSADPSLRTVDLQMMTTDLTHGRPRRLPSGYHTATNGKVHLDDGGGLVFDPDELGRFFPETVITYMKDCGKAISDERKDKFPATWRRFPMGPEMPVIVATRMSLSFPVLIAAVPLWDVDYEDKPDQPRKRVVLSDGGITSNFPVHFFDTALPRRPTFGLNLTTLPRAIPIPEGVGNQASAVRRPRRASERELEDPRDIEKLGQFFSAIKDAMQNWRDNLQAAQPGFRDRMVPVMLGKGEGGMTLNMSREKINDLSARGGVAGRYLVERFAVEGDAADTPWNEHRFGRFRITMAVTEQFMKDFQRAYVAPPDAPGIDECTRRITMSYALRVAAATKAPYVMSKGQRDAAIEVAERYCATLPGVTTLVDGAPRPRSVLRVVPPT